MNSYFEYISLINLKYTSAYSLVSANSYILASEISDEAYQFRTVYLISG